jgi:septum site-determining protein MinD
LAAADEVIVVVIPDLACLADALRLRMMCEVVRTPVGGIVVNRTGLSKGELPSAEIGSMLDLEVLSVIPEDAEVRKSASLKVPVVIAKSDSPAASAQTSLARSVIEAARGEAQMEHPEVGRRSSRLRSIFVK